MPPADQRALGATLMALPGGSAGRDVAALTSVHAKVADWLNAFGTALTVRAAVRVWRIVSELYMVARRDSTYAGGGGAGQGSG